MRKHSCDHLGSFSILFLVMTMGLSAQRLRYYSQEKEAALGAQLAAGVRRHSTVIANSEIQAQIDRIGRNLGDGNFTFAVIADRSDGGRFSAYEPVSLPGGAIFVSSRLILAARDEAELAGMLAHGMAHISARHGIRLATHGQNTNLTTIPLIFVGASGLGASALLPLGFVPAQRGFELEADGMAAASMAAAGYDPRELAGYISREQRDPADRMRDRSAIPLRESRVAAIERELPTGVQVPRTMDPAGFLRVQELTRASLPPPARLPSLDQPPRLRR